MCKSKEQFLEDFLIELGYSEVNMTFTPATSQKNFFGSVYRVHVAAVKNGVRTEERLFLKMHSDWRERNERVKIQTKFKREAVLYNTVIAEYEQIQKHLPDEEKQRFPLCWYADETWLVLEDLIDFRTLDEKSSIDLNHLKMMIVELAKFHVLSFVLRYKKPDIFENIVTEIEKPNIACKERRSFLITKVWQWTMNALENEETIEKLKNMKDLIFKEYDDVLNTEYTVISHGDYNLRNVLFTYDQTGMPKDMRMIDFQLSYVTSPVADLFFALFSSTDSIFRRKHYLEMVNLYYENLSRLIQLHGLDVKKVYSKEMFENDFKTYLPRELMTILTVIRIMGIAFKESSEKNEGTGTILDYNCEKAEKIFKDKIVELFDDFITFELI